MEVHVVDRNNRHLYGEVLDASFALRAEVFVREMQWRALQEVDARERDQFDTPEAVYFLAVDRGRVAGGLRRHCSLQPTLLSEVFPYLAARGFERAPDVYEGTRIHVAPEWRTEHPNKVAGYLNWAFWAHTLAQGGRAVHLVTYAQYVPTMIRSGLRPRPLGPPTRHEDMDLMAVAAAVNEDVLIDLLTFYDIAPVPLRTEGTSLAPAKQVA